MLKIEFSSSAISSSGNSRPSFITAAVSSLIIYFTGKLTSSSTLILYKTGFF